MIFILIERQNPHSISWWEINTKDELDKLQTGNVKLYSECGSHNYFISSDTLLEVVEYKDWDSFIEIKEHKKKTSLYKELEKNSTNKDLKIGWLSPDGQMHRSRKNL